MALFKILKGQEKNLPANKTEGWAYVTTDEGNMYVDVSASKRVRIGAHADKADVATKAEGDTKPIREIYLAKLKQVTSDGTTFSFRGETGNGTNAPDLISIPLAGDKAGLISNAAQTIKGEKTFVNGIKFPTIAAWPTPSTETYPIKSQGLSWSGSSDNAAIFYEVQASDKGMLVIESGDDTNAGLEIRNAASKKKVTIVDGRFIGDLTGTADYASKAQGDSQTIRSKYVSSVVKKSGSNYIFTVTKGDGTTNDVDLYFAASSSCGGDANVARSLRGAGRLDTQEKIDNFLTGSLLQYAVFKTAAQNNVNFASNDGMILSIPWDSSDYGAQIAFDDNTTPAVKVRGKNKTWGAWKTVAFTDGTIENANYADKAKGDTTSIRTTYIHKIKQVTSDGTTFTFRGEYGDGSNANDLISIPAASSSIAGLITTGAQTIAGNKTFSTSLIASAISGFNYSGIETASGDVNRPIWFAHSSKNGTPVINSSKFTYNPHTNRMVVGSITLNGLDIAGNYLTKVEKIDNIKVKATTGDGTSNTFTLDFLPLAGGTMTGAINFDHAQKRIISRTQLNSTTVNSGNNAHKLTLPTNDNVSTGLMMHVTNGNNDFGVFYLSEDTAFIANSGDTGYLFKIIDKDNNSGTTNYNDNISTMFAVKQNSEGIIMRGPLEPLVTESQNIGSTTMFWNNVYAKYFKGIADRATSDSGNQVIVDTYIKSIEYITHATQPKLKYTKGGGSTTELNMPIASATNAGLVTADAKDVVQIFSGDKTFNGCVRIKPTSDNGRQGLRIGSVGGWSMITLGASTDAGYETNSWHIADNNGAFYITHSDSNSSTTGRLASDTNGNWEINNRLGINGKNVGYQFYVNGTSLHTNTINIEPNTVALNFRYNDANLYSTISYQTSGNEALVFANKYPYASFLFITNEDSVTNHGNNRWQSLTNTGLQIKENSVQIGGLWGHNVHPDYKLKVNGTAYISGYANVCKIYNSGDYRNSSSVTFNDLALSNGAACGMIYAATNNPTGSGSWCHTWSQSWSNGSNANWVSQIALGTQIGTGMWYRCTSGSIVDRTWRRVLDNTHAAIDSGIKLTSGYSWISIAGTSSFTCPDGTTITQPDGANPMVLYAGAASARDCGIFYLSNDNAYVANSSDNAYTFGVFDTDITQNFSTEGNASLCVRSNGAGTFIRSRLGVNGINDSYNFYVNGTSYFNGQVTATQFNGPLNGNATSATILAYGPMLNSDAAIDSFHAANTFQTALWNNTSSPGASNGIILDMGWTSAAYGAQLAIDDDPSYFIALRQRDGNGWKAWKRIPMGDGTGASGTWNISISGNADTLDGYHASTVYRAATHRIQNYSATNDWLRIATITINGSTLSMGGFTAIFSNRECLDNSSFILTVAIRRNSTTSVDCQAYVTPIGTNAPREILVRSDDGVNFYVYFKSVLNSWTTYYNVTKIMSENNVTFENVSLPASNLIAGSVLNVTASRGGYVYRAQNADVATNADTIDGYHHDAFVKKSGDTMTGMLRVNNAPIFGYRYGQSNNAPAFVFDKPGSHYTGIGANGSSDTIYFGAVSADNNWNWVTSYKQKWVFNGNITADKVYGAVWNDYAEYRSTSIVNPGQCVVETGFGDLIQSTERLQPGANIVSDTFGFAIGETEQTKTPLAVSGRVLAYPYEDRDSYQAGDPVCSGPNGTISKMTREEVREYPDRIIGTVSEIPEYETWGTGKVKVNGRIWIKVK